jgi:hypothetical protein
MTAPDASRRDVSDVSLFLLVLFFFGFVLTAMVVPGIFTVDENNYLINVIALRQGHVTVANTAGLTPSRELLFFDPVPWTRAVTSTPVASTAPPLYAVIALPFSYFGWRGLVALNTLAYLATTLMIFWWLRRFSEEKSTPWLGAAAFALGGFSLEYSTGLWPHSLSVALCTAGTLSTALSVENRSSNAAALAGFLLALATGVRYQNAVVLAAGGAFLVFWSARRLRSGLAFVGTAAIPLLASSVINYVRFESWNPVSKGPGYLQVPLISNAGSSWRDPLIMFWARVVDYSVRPVLTGPVFEGWFVHDATTGANLMLGVTLKKALLQSAPWAALSLLLFAMVWYPKTRLSNPIRRQLQLMSFVTVCVFALFALSSNRDDGFCFNQRYLLEIVPLCAIAFGFACDGWILPRRPLIGGLVSGAVLVLVILVGTPMVATAENPKWVIRQLSLLHIPLVLAATLCGVWVCGRVLVRYRSAVAAVAGVCLGWSLVLHVGDDVLMTSRIRKSHFETTNSLATVVAGGTAVLTSWGAKESLGPLLFSRDIVIIAAGADEGEDAPVLVRELHRQGRRVFLLDQNIPPHVRERAIEGVAAILVPKSDPPLLELRPIVG